MAKDKIAERFDERSNLYFSVLIISQFSCQQENPKMQYKTNLLFEKLFITKTFELYKK